MNPELATTLGGAFVFGAATSLHCVGMCGPLACVACQRGAGCTKLQSALQYQVARLGSYTVLGALAGCLGWMLGPRLASVTSSLHPLAWIGLVAALVGVGFLVHRRFPLHPRQLLSRIAPAWIGLATPLIPCGPLYLVFGLAALSGSAIRGATLALVFGLGTLPLLWLAQHQWGRLQALLGTRRARFLQRGIIAVAVLLVAWRVLPNELLAHPGCRQPPPP